MSQLKEEYPMSKSIPRIMKYGGADFQPRFEYGDQAQAAHLCGAADGSELGAGLVRLTGAKIPWTVKYDEIILVLEGSFSVVTDQGVLVAEKMDSIWLPAGTKLEYQAEEALLFYAIHPSNWADKVNV